MNQLMNEKTLFYNKTKLVWSVLGCGLFVWGGFSLLFYKSARALHPSLINQFIGILGILFFGFGGVVILYKLAQNRPYLISNKEGLTYFVGFKDNKGVVP
jgi:hypothetical protein